MAAVRFIPIKGGQHILIDVRLVCRDRCVVQTDLLQQSSCLGQNSHADAVDGLAVRLVHRGFRPREDVRQKFLPAQVGSEPELTVLALALVLALDLTVLALGLLPCCFTRGSLLGAHIQHDLLMGFNDVLNQLTRDVKINLVQVKFVEAGVHVGKELLVVVGAVLLRERPE